MQTVNEQLSKVIKFMDEKNFLGVKVSLHLHFDKDEDFDYTGMHTIDVSVDTMEYNELVKADRHVCHSHQINLEGWSVEDCRKEYEKVYQEIRKIYSDVKKAEYTHDNGGF
jgi:hypothetical protein